jgi:thioredoxin 1
LSDSELNKILAEKSKKMVAEHSRMTHAHVAELNESSFDKLISGQRVTFVDFWAVWCGPCKTMEPVVERLASKLGGSVNFGKVNVDEHPTLATKFEVQSIPTFMMFKNGNPVDAVIGTMQEGALEQRIRKAAGI